MHGLLRLSDYASTVKRLRAKTKQSDDASELFRSPRSQQRERVGNFDRLALLHWNSYRTHEYVGNTAGFSDRPTGANRTCGRCSLVCELTSNPNPSV